jgi:hypothetical protein
MPRLPKLKAKGKADGADEEEVEAVGEHKVDGADEEAVVEVLRRLPRLRPRLPASKERPTAP